MRKLKTEAEAIINEINREIRINSTIAQDQEEYTVRNNSLCEKYKSIQEEINKANDKISDLKARKTQADKFFKAIKTIREPVAKFDENLWNNLVEKVVVYSKRNVRVVWRDEI